MQRQLFYKRAAGFFFGVVAMVAGSAIALQIDYGTTTGSAISFNGSGGFSFNPGVGSFRVTSGNAAGLLGDISGTFNIGSITTSGGVSSAPVSGSSQFVIHDAANNSLTGTLTMADIVQVGTGSTLNSQGVINLSGLSYNGTNPDLIALAAAGSGMNVITFQFASPITLQTMASTVLNTSFSGSVFTEETQVPDGGATVMLLGLALSGLALVRRTLA